MLTLKSPKHISESTLLIILGTQHAHCGQVL